MRFALVSATRRGDTEVWDYTIVKEFVSLPSLMVWSLVHLKRKLGHLSPTEILGPWDLLLDRPVQLYPLCFACLN